MSKILKNQVPRTTFLDEEDDIEVKMVLWPNESSIEKLVVNVSYGHGENPEIYDTFTEEQRKQAIDTAVKEGSLPKCMEMIGNFVFLVKNLPLTATHCLVRHRTLTVLQSSTAVSDLRHVNFMMPKSFARNEIYYHKVKQWMLEGKQLYIEGVEQHGLSSQNARIMISKNNDNHMFICGNLSALRMAYGQRVCRQEEPVTNNIVFEAIKKHIVSKFPYLESYFVSDCEKGTCLHCKCSPHSNIVFKRNELHSKNVPKDWVDKTLHDQTRDEMNAGKTIVRETFLGKTLRIDKDGLKKNK
jgi:thymidylate synthase ThyX